MSSKYRDCVSTLVDVLIFEQSRSTMSTAGLKAGEYSLSTVPYPHKNFEEFYLSQVENRADGSQGGVSQVMRLRPILPGINVKTQQMYEKLWKDSLVVIFKKSAKDAKEYVIACHEKWAVKKCTLQHIHGNCGIRLIEILAGNTIYRLDIKTSLECSAQEYAKLSTVYIPRFKLPAPPPPAQPSVVAMPASSSSPAASMGTPAAASKLAAATSAAAANPVAASAPTPKSARTCPYPLEEMAVLGVWDDKGRIRLDPKIYKAHLNRIKAGLPSQMIFDGKMMDLSDSSLLGEPLSDDEVSTLEKQLSAKIAAAK